MLRGFTCLFALVILLLGAAERGAAQPGPNPESFLRCVDVSFLDELEAAGAVYRDGGAVDDALRIFQRHGINAVRLRLFHAPPSGQDGLPDALALAARAHALDFRIILDFHFSDTWADPGHQAKPAAWQALSYETLGDSVAAYTRSVLEAFEAQGTVPDIVQVGNEVTTGILWDEGRVGGAFDTPGQWGRFAELLQHAITGIRQAVGAASSVMIHVDRGGDPDGAAWFFDRLTAQGVSFDLIGLSYYPWWHGPLASFDETLDLLADRYRVPILVAETAYPWTLGWFDGETNIVGLPEQLHPGYPATPEGQAAFVHHVVATVEHTSSGLGKGVCYWSPDYVAAPGLGSPWENLALFDEGGEVLPAASALGGGLPTGRVEPSLSSRETLVYPNPAASRVRIRYLVPEWECTRVVFYDGVGRVVAETSGGCGTGAVEVSQSVAGLAAGVYSYVVYGQHSGKMAQGRLAVIH
ncbi:MAG: glycosyl hydrolase 53 family protein [Rhodothermales bacterium]